MMIEHAAVIRRIALAGNEGEPAYPWSLVTQDAIDRLVELHLVEVVGTDRDHRPLYRLTKDGREVSGDIAPAYG
ncbi:MULTISPECIES: hypothetical protein [unclassified Chelatococcus]|jgi:hypothetical protein|uniref:hypothetical protein n=1 Tax=unclassified Chelatococcus TaxID=2638111 RepID=UPI001BCF2F90|nr:MULTISPECIES: hypothetical protein [unclassified Chelatococcus]CAH1671668.1 hypothetical protein CHELA41_23569 [Hyphomicrobiales bacterium]MBS7738492.1 hypothetical protein [Chelatococcus sp. HY11]MBX3542896.1 hypothetical protein [Chelatococcus sp.]MCO5076977.1 hypothetical protein [Chelatococcus sp.]CAH1676123.1 hypothetical protein CHELA20_51447 [Hyphomicrobiales bacterium]